VDRACGFTGSRLPVHSSARDYPPAHKITRIA
jgi:hypothetical protein